jgi:hypothetical protein
MTQRRILLGSLLLLSALIVSSLPFYELIYRQGHDWIFELVRVAEYKYALLNGQIPPYWGEDLYGGYGSPVFLFYAPLFSFAASLCSAAMNSVAAGSIAAIMVFSFIAVISMKLLLDEAIGGGSPGNEAASRMASYLFILNPYLLCNKLIRNANAEYTALCLFPFAVYGLFLIRRRSKAGGLVLSGGIALIILAHNLTALIAIAVILVLTAILYLPDRKKSSLAAVFLSLCLGLGLSSFFWIPALFHTSFVRIEQMLQGKFDFHNQFKPVSSFFQYEPFYSAGLLPLAVIAGSIGALWIFRSQKEEWRRKLIISFLAGAFIFFFMQTRLSIFLWENVPFMPLFQFPWRMMGPFAFVISVLGGLTLACLFTGRSKTVIISTEIIFLCLCIFNAVPHLRDNKPLSEEITTQLPEILDAGTIAQKGLRATVGDEYLPAAADPEIWRIQSRQIGPVVSSVPVIQIEVLKNSGTEILLTTSSSSPARLTFARWYFPVWECNVNSVPCKVEKNEAGAVDISIPSGDNRIELNLKPPHARRITSWVSFFCLVLWSGILIWPEKPRQAPPRKRKKKGRSPKDKT